jgi:acyl-CoA reductase-like NAD-dependent aldehyde dehydrogenase
MAKVPLIINGKDIILDEAPANAKAVGFQGATPDLAVDAVESCAAAFVSWSQTSAQTRRDLLLKLAQVSF